MLKEGKFISSVCCPICLERRVVEFKSDQTIELCSNEDHVRSYRELILRVNREAYPWADFDVRDQTLVLQVAYRLSEGVKRNEKINDVGSIIHRIINQG